MSATPPSSLQGTQAISPIEMLWHRYRSLIFTVVAVAIGAIGVNYGIKYYNQKQTDASWSSIVASMHANDAYGDYNDRTKMSGGLIESLSSVDIGELEKAVAAAPKEPKAFLLWALANRAVVAKDWDRAEKALKELETSYPQHSLVAKTKHPVQVQDEIKKDEAKPNPNQKPKVELQPAVEGSAVAALRSRIELEKAYTQPEQFKKVVPPVDAPKLKFEFSSGYGECVIALMPESPLHREAMLKLAETEWWKDIAVDEIHRPVKSFSQPRALHFGYETTKAEDDRSKWLTTEPSKNLVDWEKNSLSHFPGAVSMQAEADGKSCADRIWISIDDAPSNDGTRVIVGYVVEGLENLSRISDAALSVQDEESGRGRPTENIRITKVSVIK
ncbi:MAG: peptidylprolyl isomerase [Planctomycetes bacterium]|nr:peptidylprolyl isomerase [Planctomycetota bacterium]MCC7397447.1 peptidylprolyl isomerase [Planctomycetota bacterium]